MLYQSKRKGKKNVYPFHLSLQKFLISREIKFLLYAKRINFSKNEKWVNENTTSLLWGV